MDGWWWGEGLGVFRKRKCGVSKEFRIELCRRFIFFYFFWRKEEVYFCLNELIFFKKLICKYFYIRDSYYYGIFLKYKFFFVGRLVFYRIYMGFYSLFFLEEFFLGRRRRMSRMGAMC